MSTTAINDEPQRRSYKAVAILMGVLTLFFTCMVYGGYALAGVPLAVSILFAMASKVKNPRTSDRLAIAGALVILAVAVALIGFKVHSHLFPQTSS